MSNSSETNFFLGANSASGFYSLYDDFTDPEKDVLYIIKGGPGCGKSTFMKKIADALSAAGLDTERIQCSGDPDSLDGVYFPALNIGYVDGTSPHVIEPRFAGSSERYINLGKFYDYDALHAQNGEIMCLTKGYKAFYPKAYRLISGGAAAVSAAKVPIGEKVLVSVAKRAGGIVSREIPHIGKKRGRTVRRFVSAITCHGLVYRYDTVSALAERIYAIDNDMGLAPLVIETVASAAEQKGFDMIRCLDPITPDVTSHLILPELSLAFVSQSSKNRFPGKVYRHLRLDAAANINKSSAQDIKSARKLSDMLFSEAIKALAGAKSIHDALEKLYNPHVDFAGVITLAEHHINALLAKA